MVQITFAGSGDAFGSSGRMNTCIIVDAPGTRFAIDFGASSLIALSKLGIAHNSIDTILLTHLHGDHGGGIPPMLIDAMLGAKREAPLKIAGPPGTRAWLAEVQEALFPGSSGMSPKFGLVIEELCIGGPHLIGDLKVTTWPAVHTAETNPTQIRVEVAGKTIAYTGDGSWTEDTLKLADHADVLITECYFYSKPVKYHMNYPDIQANRDRLNAKRLILTHMGPEMLDNANRIAEECAYDGMIIEI
ncbi:MAG: MBL fold metallo-hydrolase [Pseudomonadota bacterium]